MKNPWIEKIRRAEEKLEGSLYALTDFIEWSVQVENVDRTDPYLGVNMRVRVKDRMGEEKTISAYNHVRMSFVASMSNADPIVTNLVYWFAKRLFMGDLEEVEDDD